MGRHGQREIPRLDPRAEGGLHLDTEQIGPAEHAAGKESEGSQGLQAFDPGTVGKDQFMRGEENLDEPSGRFAEPHLAERGGGRKCLGGSEDGQVRAGIDKQSVAGRESQRPTGKAGSERVGRDDSGAAGGPAAPLAGPEQRQITTVPRQDCIARAQPPCRDRPRPRRHERVGREAADVRTVAARPRGRSATSPAANVPMKAHPARPIAGGNAGTEGKNCG